MAYTVRQGEGIVDVVLNATGDITNYDTILTANNFDTWTPDVYSGQVLTIPNTVNINTNNYRGLASYPANNSVTNDIISQINIIFDILNNPGWILQSGRWNGLGIWTNNGTWNTV